MGMQAAPDLLRLLAAGLRAATRSGLHGLGEWLPEGLRLACDPGFSLVPRL